MAQNDKFEFTKIGRLSDLPKGVNLREYYGVTAQDILNAYHEWADKYSLKIFMYQYKVGRIFVRWEKRPESNSLS